jgi:hypothetical protein
MNEWLKGKAQIIWGEAENGRCRAREEFDDLPTDKRVAVQRKMEKYSLCPVALEQGGQVKDFKGCKDYELLELLLKGKNVRVFMLKFENVRVVTQIGGHVDGGSHASSMVIKRAEEIGACYRDRERAKPASYELKLVQPWCDEDLKGVVRGQQPDNAQPVEARESGSDGTAPTDGRGLAGRDDHHAAGGSQSN